MIYLLSTWLYLSFAVHKIANFSSNTGKVHFEGLVHLLGYISYNKTLVLKCYDDIKNAPLSNLLRQYNIKTENQLMYLFDSSWKDFPYTFRRTGAYIIFISVGQFTMAHMLQDQFLDKMQKVSTVQHALQECI